MIIWDGRFFLRYPQFSWYERGLEKNFQTQGRMKRRWNFLEGRGAARTAGRLPDSQGESTPSKGYWSVFIAREQRTCESSADWAGYVYFQCAEREKNGTNIFPYMGWERDRACCLGGLWEIVMVAVGQSDKSPVTLCSGNVGPLSLSCSLSLEHHNNVLFLPLYGVTLNLHILCIFLQVFSISQ